MRFSQKIPADYQLFNAGYSFHTFFLLKIIVLIFLTTGSFSNKILAQEAGSAEITDSVKVHSARKATFMSMALPGLGQAYNKKYWKIPVIYAGFGVLVYFVHSNGSEYRKFREAYDIVATNDSSGFNNEYVQRYNLTQLQDGRNYYRRNYELSLILTGLLYVLNIIDASVDANLYSFEINDDVSLRFEPMSDQYFTYKPVPAIGLRYRF